MHEDLGRATSDAPVHDALARAAPDSIDAAILRERMTAKLFGVASAPARFGRFELRDRIGHGGMGVVYRAWDPQLHREVAIKLVDTGDGDDGLRERALAEARALAKLVHPNVVTVFESGHVGHRVWIAMELLQGTTMQAWLQREPPPEQRAILAAWMAVGRGLAAAHAVGLVHRDIKPSNVLVGDDGWPRLIDFGLVHAARAVVATPDDDDDAGAEPRRTDATSAGFVGTYRYAAPEQRRGEVVDARADQHALCTCIWEACCGALPPAAAPGRSLDRRLRTVLLRGLSEAPADRHASVSAMLEALDEAIAAGRTARRRWLVAAAAATIAGSVFAARTIDTGAPLPSPCAREDAALAGTWDEPRRAALRSGIAVSDPTNAAATLATLEQGLDAWATRWTDARRSACMATRVDGTQTEAMLGLRHDCLEQRRRALQVTLETWSTPAIAREASMHAPALLGRLPELEACEDPTRLAELEPPPSSATAREAVGLARDRLTEARALADMGQIEHASQLVGSQLSLDVVTSYAPLRLELESFAPLLDVERGKIFAAVPRLVSLAREADERRLDVLSAELRSSAAEAAAGRWSGATAEALLVAEAQSAVRRLARPREPLQPRLRHAEAALRLHAGDFAAALEGFTTAEAEARALGQTEQAQREGWSIAATLGQLGRHDEARRKLEQGRNESVARWGARAPLVGAAEFDLAVLALESGELGAVDAHLDRARSIFADAFGVRSLRVARVDYARAKARLAEGSFADALALVQRATPIYEAELGPDHELLAELHEARGVLQFFTGDLEGSLASYEAALALARRAFGPDHPTLARLHSNLGESQAALGRLAEAQHSFDDALEIYARTLPSDHPDLGLPLKGRGQIALATGRPARAVEDLERALALQRSTGAEPLEIADIEFSLAQALVQADAGRRDEARELATSARTAFAARHQDDRVRDVDAWRDR